MLKNKKYTYVYIYTCKVLPIPNIPQETMMHTQNNPQEITYLCGRLVFVARSVRAKVESRDDTSRREPHAKSYLKLKKKEEEDSNGSKIQKHINTDTMFTMQVCGNNRRTRDCQK